MKQYVLEWHSYIEGPGGRPIREYFKYELDAMNRQKEIEGMIRVLGLEMKCYPYIYEILVKE